MPKVSYGKRPPSKYIAHMIRDYQKQTGKTCELLALALGKAPDAVSKEKNRPDDMWRVAEMKRYCRALDIPFGLMLSELAEKR